MKFRLKKGQEGFEMVDGPLAGRSYKPCSEYDEKDVPVMYARRFEKVAAPEQAPAKNKGGHKK